MVSIPVLYADETPSKVNRHSSVDQYGGTFLCVIKGGRQIPISFDTLDYIDCGKPVSHKSIVSNGNDIGYHFDSKHCKFVDDNYIYVDENGATVTKQLPKWFGEGTYEEVRNNPAYITADTNSFGTRNIQDFTVGLAYTLADETIQAEEESPIEMFYADESEPDVKMYSTVDQYRNYLSVVKGGVFLPISYDSLDYIDCGKPMSHNAILEVNDTIGYHYENGKADITTDRYVYDDGGLVNSDTNGLGTLNAHTLRVGLGYAAAKNTIEAEGTEGIEMHYADEEETVKRVSTADQYKGFLCIIRGGRYVPISFDTLDYIDCGKPVSHKTVVEYGDEIGYRFGDKTCGGYVDRVVIDDGGFINSDTNSLGVVNDNNLVVSTDYVISTKTLAAEE